MALLVGAHFRHLSALLCVDKYICDTGAGAREGTDRYYAIALSGRFFKRVSKYTWAAVNILWRPARVYSVWETLECCDVA